MAVSIGARKRKPGRAGEERPTWWRALRVWSLVGLAPVLLVAGFNVGVDAEGYFGLNDYGSYGGDERLIKASMMGHAEYDALLLGDSRASFTDVSEIAGYDFFNAGVGGGRMDEYLQFLKSSDKENLRLVVLLEGAGIGGCGEEDEQKTPSTEGIAGAGTGGLENLFRYALSFDALQTSATYLLNRARGYLPDHHADGTRYPDSRLQVPFDWNGMRAERYLAKVDDYAKDGPLEDGVGVSPACREMLFQMREIANEAGAEFLFVLYPINADIVSRTRTDVARLRENVRERILDPLPFARDYTVSEFSGGRHYGPYDPVHFLPDSGAELLKSAIRRRG